MRAVLLIAFWLGLSGSAFADTGPVIVIPGRPGVPIIVNGIDVSYAVIEGDWGLARGTHEQLTIYGGRLVAPPEVGHWYPSLGRLPGYGRLEVQPPANRKLPQPAESYYRSWSSQSQPQVEVPANPPPIIVAPQVDIGRHWEGPHEGRPQGHRGPPHHP